MILLGFACGLMAGLAIAAVILSTACWIVRVKAPSFLAAMGICLGVSMAVGCVHLMIATTMAIASGSSDALSGSLPPEEIQGMLMRAAPIALCLHPFISAAIFSVMLSDCSFGRGLLVWVAQFVVIVMIGAAFAGLAYGIHTLGPA